MELLNFLNQLDENQEASAAAAPAPGSKPTKTCKKAGRSHAGPEAAADREGRAGSVDAEEAAADDLGDAASWDFREAFPEGVLNKEAVARIRAAKASLKPVAAAFKRHGASTIRAEEVMRRALARSYACAEALRDHPRVMNILLEEKRIKRTKPVRDNRFLAIIKIANPEAAPDTVSRWAGALACAVANNCTPELVPTFLQKMGIREAADRWAEIRRVSRPFSRKPTAPKQHPIDALRATSLGISLPAAFPLPSDNHGLLLLVVECTDEAMVAHGASNNPVLLDKAIKGILRSRAQDVSAGTKADNHKVD